VLLLKERSILGLHWYFILF